MKSVLILDGYNLMHRARSGFMLGEYPVVFNFFRSLKTIIEKFDADNCIFTLEGKPVDNLNLFSEYKENRKIDPLDEKKLLEMKNFHRQKDIIVLLLTKYFPLAVMRHPNYEADDLIYTIIKRGSSDTNYIIVSSDTDFIQILNNFENVKLYNPIKKEFVLKPDYDYVTFKSLKGDSCDNIPGIPGVGEVNAENLCLNPELLKEVLSNNENAKIFERNIELISLSEISEDFLYDLETSIPKRNWKKVKSEFESFDFKSICKEPYWTKFVESFDKLWETKK